MPIIIKRYHNRKLYNTQSKRYITLEQIEELIKQQEDIKVVDNDSGNDITATTLSQIVFELEKTQTGFLPINLLQSLVQSGGKRFDEIRRNLFATLNFSHHFDDEVERRINELVAKGEMTQEDGITLQKQLVSVGQSTDNIIEGVQYKIAGFLKDQQIPTKSDVQALMDKLDSLSAIVEGMTAADEKPGADKKDQIIE